MGWHASDTYRFLVSAGIRRASEVLKATAVLLFISPLLVEGAETVKIASFEANSDLAKMQFHNLKAERASAHATDSDHALLVHFRRVVARGGQQPEIPEIHFAAGQALERSDWRAFGSVILDAHNPGKEDVTISVRIGDDDSVKGRALWIFGDVRVPGGTTKTVFFLLRHQDALGGCGMPEVNGMVAFTRCKGSIDLSRIGLFLLMFYPASEADTEHTIYIDNIRLGLAPKFKDVVDRFGQYAFGDWSGKVHEESELRERGNREFEWLRSAPQPTDRDEYGGWAKGPQLEATGFFRTQKVDGKWWLVTPSGHLFWSVGMVGVRAIYQGRTPTQGREHLFQWLPQPGEPDYADYALFGPGSAAGSFSFYGANLWRKYGQDYLPRWLEVTTQRLRTWGFNTIGNWSRFSDFSGKIPYTVPLSSGGGPRFKSGRGTTIVDVFDQKFLGRAEADQYYIVTATKALRDDPWCLGCFVDNEVQFGDWDEERGHSLSRNVLALTGEFAAKREFVFRLKQRYGLIGKLNDAWGTKIGSWERLEKEPVEMPGRVNDAMAADLRDYFSHFARQYFSSVRNAMKQYAPNQLYLGCRLSQRSKPREVVQLQAEYADVATYNMYCHPESFAARMKIVAALDRPVIIGEFHFGVRDRGLCNGIVGVANQEERGKSYAGYITEALKQPWCVGAHWFHYVDQLLTGRSVGGENFNIGFVTITDTPYPELTSRAREVNSQIYGMRGRMK